jgi:ferritin-like metal-binding protein YciE
MRTFNDRTAQFARRLGWLSLGVGLTQMLAPRFVARVIGASPSPATRRSLRLVGLRDAALGVIILARPGRAWPIWARVGGDVVDLTLMSRAADDIHARRRLVWATGAAAGLTAVDIGCASTLTRGGPIERIGRRLRRPSQSLYQEKVMSGDQNLRALLTEDLRDMYDAERQLTKALPKFARAANSDELRETLEQHLEETEGQIGQLEEVFEALDEKPHSTHCTGMAGIIEEGIDLIHGDYEGPVQDAAIIAMVQRAEHYEITAYGTCIAWAKALGLGNVASMLGAMLEEEKEVDRALTALAEGGINTDAASVDVEDAEDSRIRPMTPSSRADNGGRRTPHTHH